MFKKIAVVLILVGIIAGSVMAYNVHAADQRAHKAAVAYIYSDNTPDEFPKVISFYHSQTNVYTLHDSDTVYMEYELNNGWYYMFLELNSISMVSSKILDRRFGIDYASFVINAEMNDCLDKARNNAMNQGVNFVHDYKDATGELVMSVVTNTEVCGLLEDLGLI